MSCRNGKNTNFFTLLPPDTALVSKKRAAPFGHPFFAGHRLHLRPRTSSESRPAKRISPRKGRHLWKNMQPQKQGILTCRLSILLNPAPADVVDIPIFIGSYTSPLLQDFFHQQYHLASYISDSQQ